MTFEVTGNAYEVYDLVSPHVGKILLAQPTAARERGSGRKTDRLDAERLVMRLANGTLPTVWVPPQPIRSLRRLLRLRARLDSRRRGLANQVRAVLRRNGPPVPQGRDVIGWLEEHPAWLERLPADERLLVLSVLRPYRCLAEEVAALTAEVARRLQAKPSVQNLLTIPGVSLLTAAHLYAYLGDPDRFPGPKQVARYAAHRRCSFRRRRTREKTNTCSGLTSNRSALCQQADHDGVK